MALFPFDSQQKEHDRFASQKPQVRRDLERELKQAKREIERLQNRIQTLERNCQHDWNDPVYTPKVRKGYHDPGDPPNTMGVDRRFPSYVPEQQTPQWTRFCPNCGKTETTTQVTTIAKKVPKW